MTHTVYFDNAATTRLDPKVLEAMMPYLTEFFGNPSSAYSIGRSTRMAVEGARKTVAGLLGTKSSSIYFTSGGTESNNTAMAAAIRDLGCNCIITSPIEHHAVLHTAEYYCHRHDLPLLLVNLNDKGEIDYDDLEQKLKEQSGKGYKCFVSLMHANNETGALLDIKRVGSLVQRFEGVFHSDCVQTIGHYPIDLSAIPVHFISAAGHKFHGPKGVGILYVHPSVSIQPLIYGGGQERNMRAGTENVHGIVGFARALELSMENFAKDCNYISGLKAYMKETLCRQIPGVCFNSPEDSLYTVLNVCFPRTEAGEMLLLQLDMQGICVSGGSACSSGAGGSHVIKAMGRSSDCTAVRFSFSKENTSEEIDRVVKIIKTILVSENAAIV